MNRRADIHEVAAQLNACAAWLAKDLFPGGHVEGADWCIGGLDGSPGQSLRICIRGNKQGRWYEHAEGRGSDMLGLIAETRYGGSLAAALRWAVAWLGLDNETSAGRSSPRLRPAPGAGSAIPGRAPAAHDIADALEREAEERRRSMARAQAAWLGAEPCIKGTPVEAYLAGRGIDLARLGRQPRSLRYHPELWTDGAYRPAMVACILSTSPVDRYQTMGAHRTFLARAADGAWGKAQLSNGRAKRILGAAKGGVIPIWRGRSSKGLRLAPPDDTVVVCEGIEDALSVAMVWPEVRVMACISIGNLACVNLPEQLRDVIVAADADAVGSPADKALRKACQTLLAQGRRVRVAKPPAGAKDFNAYLTGAA